MAPHAVFSISREFQLAVNSPGLLLDLETHAAPVCAVVHPAVLVQ